MKIKTSELEGAALDWAVAMAICPESFKIDRKDSNGLYPWCIGWLRNGSPSTDWSQGGPLIEQYCLPLHYNSVSVMWGASACMGRLANGRQEWAFMSAPTPLVAACRAIVAANLGDVVDVPEGLGACD